MVMLLNVFMMFSILLIYQLELLSFVQTMSKIKQLKQIKYNPHNFDKFKTKKISKIAVVLQMFKRNTLQKQLEHVCKQTRCVGNNTDISCTIPYNLLLANIYDLMVDFTLLTC